MKIEEHFLLLLVFAPHVVIIQDELCPPCLQTSLMLRDVTIRQPLAEDIQH